MQNVFKFLQSHSTLANTCIKHMIHYLYSLCFPMHQPLAYYLRPITLDQMVGQESIRQTITSFLEKGQVPSMIFR
jgi:replication-associated recombination protein RarA